MNKNTNQQPWLNWEAYEVERRYTQYRHDNPQATQGELTAELLKIHIEVVEGTIEETSSIELSNGYVLNDYKLPIKATLQDYLKQREYEEAHEQKRVEGKDD